MGTKYIFLVYYTYRDPVLSVVLNMYSNYNTDVIFSYGAVLRNNCICTIYIINLYVLYLFLIECVLNVMIVYMKKRES